MSLSNLILFAAISARVLLAGVFGLAGAAKLADRAAAGRSLTEFGVPGQLAEMLAGLLALTELVLAAAVLPTVSARLGAAGIASLLTLFITVIAVTLARGRKPACHCFGQLRSEPIGPPVVVRNLALWFVAAFVVWDAAPLVAGGHVAATWPAAAQVVASATGAALLAAASFAGLGLVTVTLLTVLRQYGRLLLRVERLESEVGIQHDEAPAGLPVGSVAPAFELATLAGGRESLDSLQANVRSVVLVFVEPDCGACTEVLPDVAAAQQRLADASTQSVRIVVVSLGSVRENRAKAAGLDAGAVLLQRNREVANAYAVVGTPSAVRVTGGLIATSLAAGPSAVRELLEASARPVARLKVGVGDEVPSMSLTDLDARPVDLRTVARGRTLLVFWNPSCGYCQQMLPDLKAWEHSPDSHDTSLLVISQGGAAANREQGLRSHVLLDEHFTVGKAFGATGTPSAVLLDQGRIVSDVEAGANAVLTIARPHTLVLGA